MKFEIISLNTYNARFKDEYFNFLDSHRPDVFCFQEINSGLEPVVTSTGSMIDQYYQTLLRLPEYYGYHNTRQDDWHMSSYDKARPWGNAIFVKKGIKILSYREDYILGHRNSAEMKNIEKTLPVSAQTIILEIEGNLYSIVNFHGYYAGTGVGKKDCPERLEQSKALCEHISKLPGKVILLGDFNLDPETESIKILEDFPLDNLITKYKIESTRTHHYPAEKKQKSAFADYAFVGTDVEVLDFSADESFTGSDHAPLFLSILV